MYLFISSIVKIKSLWSKVNFNSLHFLVQSCFFFIKGKDDKGKDDKDAKKATKKKVKKTDLPVEEFVPQLPPEEILRLVEKEVSY